MHTAFPHGLLFISSLQHLILTSSPLSHLHTSSPFHLCGKAQGECNKRKEPNSQSRPTVGLLICFRSGRPTLLYHSIQYQLPHNTSQLPDKNTPKHTIKVPFHSTQDMEWHPFGQREHQTSKEGIWPSPACEMLMVETAKLDTHHHTLPSLHWSHQHQCRQHAHTHAQPTSIDLV